MSFGKNVAIGIFGMFLEFGIDIINIDLDNHVLILEIPKDSYLYHLNDKGVLKDPESTARRIKETWIEMGIFPESCKVRYKEKDIFWTEEMGKERFERNRTHILEPDLWV